MTTASTLVDPTDALRAAIRELHERLRELVESTDPEDPSLLDRVRQLSRTVGRRISSAQKRLADEIAPAEPAVPAVPTLPAEPVVTVEPATAQPANTASSAVLSDPPTLPVVPSAGPRHAKTTPAAARSSANADAATVRLTPAAWSDCDTVKLPRGRHRRQSATPRWVYPLAAVLLIASAVIMVALGGAPWWIVAGTTFCAGGLGALVRRALESGPSTSRQGRRLNHRAVVSS